MKYFGTDGFRGIANEGLTVDHAFKIGKFMAWYFTNHKEGRVSCVIGKDTRRSSYMFEYALAAGLSSAGADVYLLHVTTTPSVSYVTKTGDFDFGIMITASHNPYYDNGVKIIDTNGYKMDDRFLEKVEDYLDGKTEAGLAFNEKIGKITDYLQGRNAYISYLVASTARSFRGYKIGLDCANGASSNMAKMIFEVLGAKTYVIHNEPDGLNINVDCGSTHIESLQKYVVENGLDIGFAFDGDADRCLAVDENGKVMDGDMILYICGLYLKEKGQLVDNTIVATIMSNLGFEKALKREHISLVRTKVGDKYISEQMHKHGYSIGGEQTGHIIFNKYATTGDGLLTAVKLMEVIAEKKTKASYLEAGMQIYPQKNESVKVDDADEVLAREELKFIVKQVEATLSGEGRVIIRKSGTEPVIRVMVEAKEEELCIRGMEVIKKCIRGITGKNQG